MIEDLGDIVVVAPDSPRSGQSSALSVGIPLRLNLIEHYRNISFYRTNGTPVDCVKLSMNQLFDRRPDLLLSGINHGSNSGVSIVYSGTMGAALEGCIIGIPSIGFSLTSHEPDTDFSPCREIVRESCKKSWKRASAFGLFKHQYSGNSSSERCTHLPPGSRLLDRRIRPPYRSARERLLLADRPFYEFRIRE